MCGVCVCVVRTTRAKSADGWIRGAACSPRSSMDLRSPQAGAAAVVAAAAAVGDTKEVAKSCYMITHGRNAAECGRSLSKKVHVYEEGVRSPLIITTSYGEEDALEKKISTRNLRETDTIRWDPPQRI
ncbi:hypothetical protein Y032_0010g899 [Ancylostoma ceylanicum]|uniref:Uncharacterized protein n=1 Tax=Ancylostoma ceylanicum TaxID=53326 RepID=A0A016VGC6_9BILA|nr:hypothetical protein Y032_0010g899 [Ancylostoma ceylanicum]